MKRVINRIFNAAVILLCIGLLGCIPHWDVDKPPSGVGYGTKSFELESWEPPGASIDLYYWDEQKKTHLIWRQVTDVFPVNGNNFALFEGTLNVKTTSSKVEQWWPRLFAVEGVGPPVDVSDPIKMLYIKTTVLKSDLPAHYEISLVKSNDDIFRFNVGKIGGDWGQIKLARDGVLNLIHEGKGQLMKDAKTGLPYYQPNVTTELSK